MPGMMHLSAEPSTVLSFHVVQIGDAPESPADEALRSLRSFAPTYLSSFHLSLPVLHLRFPYPVFQRKGQLLTCSTPPPLTPLFLSQVHAVLKRLHCSRSRFPSFSFLHHLRHAWIFHTVRHPALLQRAGLGLWQSLISDDRCWNGHRLFECWPGGCQSLPQQVRCREDSR